MTPGYLANKKHRKKYPERRNRERQRNYSTTAGLKKNFNWGKPWTIKELQYLFISGLTDRELHSIIGRSVQAIQEQRYKIRKEGDPNG